ncbi:carboxymuconolactone decarboxylase family protein [Mesorhizobium sp. B2-3-5]|uniref:carboxymuconolactone decarboxylase family protein n=1 Tax=Mesorhizobium sp. B2-3-5 TaxID=2589958 RepID=UPI00112C5A03|nr:carboxymuconolactone decarboxylase family protein [Mesorhizobium sp. B2-3-5]TPM26886.1 carboxymuconolactone decarboxylase family protein [Mesorhizobium sp. B2-3-5]
MTITVPTRDSVSPANQAMFDSLKSQLGFVPNLYASLAHSENALGSYLALQSAKSSITGKAREVVNLVVSQVNSCAYCLAAHTAIGGMVGFDSKQIMEIRHGRASFDPKLDALAKMTKDITVNRGHGDQKLVEAFLAAGWTVENLVDVIVTIGDKTVTNLLHGVTRIPVDFPAAPELASAA